MTKRDASSGVAGLPDWWPSSNQPYIIGDNVVVMPRLPDNCIDLTVTSPPYDELREYGGHGWDFVVFKAVAKELWRITKDGGVVVWVVKDSVNKGNRSLTSYRQAIHFQTIGFNVYDVIIYSKAGASLPHSGRYHDTFEYMFVLSKGLPKTVNLIADRKNKWAGVKQFGKKTVREVDGHLTERKPRLTGKTSIRYNVWEYHTGYGHCSDDKRCHEHPAIFPDALAKDHILSWSNEGEVVFDPFVGSGTTLRMARHTNRIGLGIEINPEYEALLRDRSLSNIPRLDTYSPATQGGEMVK